MTGRVGLNGPMSAVPPPPPPPGPSSTRPSWLPWAIVGGAAALVLIAGLIAFAVAASGGTPTSVDEVADRAVSAAEDLDVSAGIDLLCDPPAAESRELLDALIADAQDRTGSDTPEVTIDVHDVDGDASGSFTAVITSAEDEFSGVEREVIVFVEDRDGRSCIAEFHFPMPGGDVVVIDKDGIDEP